MGIPQVTQVGGNQTKHENTILFRSFVVMQTLHDTSLGDLCTGGRVLTRTGSDWLEYATYCQHQQCPAQ